MPTHPTYRIRPVSRKGPYPKVYQGSRELLDEADGRVRATCDLLGRVMATQTTILDDAGQPWRLTPNRAILPTRWALTGPDGRPALHFDLDLAGKLKNPIHRVALILLGAQEQEMWRVLDTRDSLPDRILGVDPDEWAITAPVNGQAVAKLALLPRHKAPAKGLLQKLRAFLAEADKGVVSLGPRHVLAPPAALALVLLIQEMTALNNAAGD